MASSSPPEDAAYKSSTALLLHHLTINDSKPAELSGRHALLVHGLYVDVRSILGLRLPDEKPKHDEDLSSDEEEHDLAPKVELVRVDEEREDA